MPDRGKLMDLQARYRERFDDGLPMMVWRGSDDELIRLAEAAMDRGEPLTEDELIRAQGGEPAPAGALY